MSTHDPDVCATLNPVKKNNSHIEYFYGKIINNIEQNIDYRRMTWDT